MRGGNIGGIMDYSRLAQMNRPSDPVALRDEVRRLNATGLTAVDISVALRLDPSAVREMLRATP